jgi:hypothetical protein
MDRAVVWLPALGRHEGQCVPRDFSKIVLILCDFCTMSDPTEDDIMLRGAFWAMSAKRQKGNARASQAAQKIIAVSFMAGQPEF